MAIWSPSSWADDAVFILPDGAPWVEIAEAELLATLPPATERVITLTPAGHGVLQDLEGTTDTYAPFLEFFDRGSDSFHFEASLKSTGIWGSAFLVAGMKGDGRFFMPVDGPGELDDVIQTNADSIQVNSIDPIDGAYDLRFALESGTASAISYLNDDGGLGDAPNGGTLGGGIDAGDGLMQGGAQVTVAMAKDTFGDVLARVVLLEGDSGPEMAGDVKVGGDFLRIGQGTVERRSTWELQWWGATANGSRDGGGVLLIDGAAAAWLGGLDNPELLRPVSWSFGALGNSGASGSLQLDNLRGEAARTVPRITPLFADNFEAEAPVWSGHECGTNPAPAAEDGVLTVPFLALAGQCFVSRTLGHDERQLRTRFSFNMSGAGIGVGQEVTLFRGVAADGGADLIEVRVRRLEIGGPLEIVAGTVNNGGQPVELGGFPIPEADDVEIEVHWWAATTPFHGDGGLRLLIDGYPRDQVLGVDNPGAEISELALGAMHVDSGSFGFLTYESFEVWR